MKRSYLGLGLLILMLILSLGAGWAMGAVQAPVSGHLEQARELALAGQMDQARTQAEAARSAWDRWTGLRSWFADHSPLEQISGGFDQLAVYARAGEPVPFAALCAQLKSQVEAVGQAHVLNLRNFL